MVPLATRLRDVERQLWDAVTVATLHLKLLRESPIPGRRESVQELVASIEQAQRELQTTTTEIVRRTTTATPSSAAVDGVNGADAEDGEETETEDEMEELEEKQKTRSAIEVAVSAERAAANVARHARWKVLGSRCNDVTRRSRAVGICVIDSRWNLYDTSVA